ncbi:oxidoreductase NAD-binding domain-containing protein [Pochonia chlamydosporia 170]|uniref:NADH-cytochrome b5 reductase n=1 Tax=Pochonia chlamydosporia 170 TaxID=1380566 RepID=A0A179G152_METCM|nr:oxidoreductase NAD-binding domain-containing protein [Pochonia chlamydosporia 170]OAQ70979.2 oxidoreductase NAD-binding domain-containing protein [Pochonia chlamydosporia 170]
MAARILTRSRPATIISTIAASSLAIGITAKFLIQDARTDSQSSPPKVFGAGPAFFSLPLESAEMVNHNTRLLRFKFADKEAVSGLPVNSSVLTMSWPQGRWVPVARPYTPITATDEQGHLDLMVKHYPDGKSSTHLHNLQPGQSLFFVASLKGHQWKPNSFPHVTLIAGGAGITPIYQLTQAILRNPEDKTAVTLVFGVNSDRDVLLKKEFEAWEKTFPGRFKAVYTVSNPVDGSPYGKGYVTKELLKEVAPSPEGRDTMVFVCGPPSMEKLLVGDRKSSGVLQELGYRKDQIHKF